MGFGPETENEEYYRKTWYFGDKSIDYFYSDEPLRALECRAKFAAEK